MQGLRRLYSSTRQVTRSITWETNTR